MIKICKYCNNEFKSNPNNKIYCSRQCSLNGRTISRKNHYNSKHNYYLNLARNYRKLHPTYMTEYWKSHKEQRKINSRNRRIKLQEMKKLVYYKLVKNLRSRIKDALKSNTKSESTINLLGCSIEFFKRYLENQFTADMSWSNYGKWHIDHIRPCASFDLSKPEEQKKCFHYSNLQPLWAKDNLEKGAKYNDF